MVDEGTEEGRALPPVLRLRGIAKRYGGVVAIDDVSLTVQSGEIVGLIGPNGAGKTTLFDIITGLQAPSAGRVALDGRDITALSTERRARLGVRRTFQRAQLFAPLTVEDDVLTATEWRGGGGGLLADLVAAPGRRRRERARRAEIDPVIAGCGLASFRDRSAAGLPIGQARLVELARALADGPRLLLLDEPTSGLDDREAGRVADALDTARAAGAAVVLVEHDLGFVMARCDRVVVLDLGRVLADGPPAAVRDDPDVRRAYLG